MRRVGLVFLATIGASAAVTGALAWSTQGADAPRSASTAPAAAMGASAPQRARSLPPALEDTSARDGEQARLDAPHEPQEPAIRAVPRTPEALLSALSSDDPYVVLDAADGLAARHRIEAIPALAAIDIRRERDSARGVVEALGRLAGDASGAERSTATRRLVELVAQEKARDAREAPGNVLSLYEALGHTKDTQAASALELELRDPGVSLAAKTLIVEALGRLGQSRSREALTLLEQELAASRQDDLFQEQIRRELLALTKKTISGLT